MDIPSHLLPTDVEHGLSGSSAYNWVCRTRPGVTAAHIMNPDFWVHVTRRLKVEHTITVLAQDGTLDADLRVIAVDPQGFWVQTRLLRGWPAAEFEVATPQAAPVVAQQWPDRDGYVVEWGGHHKWRIMRVTGAGGKPELVFKDFPDRATAMDALANLKAAKPRAVEAA